jgi:hypothetical protein
MTSVQHGPLSPMRGKSRLLTPVRARTQPSLQRKLAARSFIKYTSSLRTTILCERFAISWTSWICLYLGSARRSTFYSSSNMPRLMYERFCLIPHYTLTRSRTKKQSRKYAHVACMDAAAIRSQRSPFLPTLMLPRNGNPVNTTPAPSPSPSGLLPPTTPPSPSPSLTESGSWPIDNPSIFTPTAATPCTPATAPSPGPKITLATKLRNSRSRPGSTSNGTSENHAVMRNVLLPRSFQSRRGEVGALNVGSQVSGRTRAKARDGSGEGRGGAGGTSSSSSAAAPGW